MTFAGPAPSVPDTPPAADRIRSTCARAGGALLAVERVQPVTTPLHHLMADGSFAVAIPVDGATAAAVGAQGPAGAQAVLELADYAPLPLREPVRSLVWIRGSLHAVPLPAVPAILDLLAAEEPNPALLQVKTAGSLPPADDDTQYTLLRLEIDSVVATDAAGAESVGVAALLAAEPDPFCAMESCWLRHLDCVHPDVVARLAARLPVQLRRGQIRPLALDRYGVWLRVEREDGDRDVRLPFSAPVDDLTGLSRAIRLLVGCPFVNGLRARR
ncbi:MAG: DUF2470 domain-containing protein [Mycobacterium sp.]|uniref:DUF2470 domain-containing protein n=1 Tax=Mycobacterium sp. TaxID=1785 RepID=UPI003CC59325